MFRLFGYERMYRLQHLTSVELILNVIHKKQIKSNLKRDGKSTGVYRHRRLYTCSYYFHMTLADHSRAS